MSWEYCYRDTVVLKGNEQLRIVEKAINDVSLNYRADNLNTIDKIKAVLDINVKEFLVKLVGTKWRTANPKADKNIAGSVSKLINQWLLKYNVPFEAKKITTKEKKEYGYSNLYTLRIVNYSEESEECNALKNIYFRKGEGTRYVTIETKECIVPKRISTSNPIGEEITAVICNDFTLADLLREMGLYDSFIKKVLMNSTKILYGNAVCKFSEVIDNIDDADTQKIREATAAINEISKTFEKELNKL